METGAHGVREAEGPGVAQGRKMRKFKITYEIGHCNERCRKDWIKLRVHINRTNATDRRVRYVGTLFFHLGGGQTVERRPVKSPFLLNIQNSTRWDTKQFDLTSRMALVWVRGCIM